MENAEKLMLRIDYEIYIIEGLVVEVKTMSTIDMDGEVDDTVLKTYTKDIDKYFHYEGEFGFMFIYGGIDSQEVYDFIDKGEDFPSYYNKKLVYTIIYSEVDVSNIVEEKMKIFKEERFVEENEIDKVKILMS